jgi:kynurenine formamidase
MIAEITHRGRTFKIDLARPLDLSMPLRASDDNVRAWHVGSPRMEPVRMGDWVGAVAAGAPVNFRDVFFNPHGHGTHTECVGHITPEIGSVNGELKKFFEAAQLISVTPEKRGADGVIARGALEKSWRGGFAAAIVIRTLPNDPSKRGRHYTGTNPPYLEEAAARWMREKGILHLLVDLPSVDREEDGGRLAAHRAFWDYPGNPRRGCTITELIFVPDEIPDGDYFLELQVAPFENDASPSRPVLYAVIK